MVASLLDAVLGFTLGASAPRLIWKEDWWPSLWFVVWVQKLVVGHTLAVALSAVALTSCVPVKEDVDVTVFWVRMFAPSTQ